MGAPLSEDYETLRIIVKGKNYELIYSALLNEVINIKKVGVDVKDIEGLENYVQNEVRELIFSSKGLPTYLIRLSILIGPVFEKDLSLKVSTYLITYYSSDFQLFISKNFKTLKSISLLYKELETIVKNFENKFFNLPTEWQILPEVMRSLYLIVKQKLCDYFYFENIQNDDYYKAFTVVLSEEKKINKYIMLSDETNIFLTNLNEKALNVKALNDKDSNNKILNDKDLNEKVLNIDFYSLNEDPYVHMLFKLFIPHIEIYLDEYFKLYNNPHFDVKDNEIKIFKPFLSVFRSFEKLYPKITYFGNESATKSLLEHVNNLITKMIDNCNNQISNKIDVLYELEESEEGRSPEHLRSFIEMIIIVLNTSEYIYEYISEFCNTLSTNYESFKELDGFNNSLGSLEKNFTQHLSNYISHILANVDFDKEDFSTDLIKNLEKYVFDMKFTEIHDDIKKLLIESIVIYILSSLYLIDFDVDKAEIYLGELSQVKTYLSKYSQSIPLFGVLECYIKIFLCPSDDVVKFVDNFLLLSNDIFSLDQIVCSLTCTNTIEDLKNEYLRRVDKKNLELEKDAI